VERGEGGRGGRGCGCLLWRGGLRMPWLVGERVFLIQ